MMKKTNGVPLDAIQVGRPLDEVLNEYMRIWGDAKKKLSSQTKNPDEVFADVMEVSAYRIYLLGVEDGMKEARK